MIFHRIIQGSLRSMAAILCFSLTVLLLWEYSPALILKPYNSWKGQSLTVNGQPILDHNKPEYIDAKPSEKICFKHIEIDSEYHSEGASVADINRDGLNDIVTGHYWYKAPVWSRHTIRPPTYEAFATPKPSDYLKAYLAGKGTGLGAIIHRAYPMAFFTFHQDVNNDGWIDVISPEMSLAPGAYWFENPKGAEAVWKQHSLTQSPIAQFAGHEAPLYTDLLQTGNVQLITGYSHVGKTYNTLAAIEIIKGEPVVHPIEDTRPHITDKGVPAHGLGYGDINGDGLQDLVVGPSYAVVDGAYQPTTAGWYQQQITADGEKRWLRHPIKGVPALSEIQILDINDDGKADFAGGVAHDRGLLWFEQLDNHQWKPHVIDDTYTQLHATTQADINGDGVNDLITGKTTRAHFGMLDPDEFGTPVLYWYEKTKTPEGKIQFIRHLINDEVGIGRQITATDINNDGLMDIAVGNRNGVHIFMQESSLCEH